MCDHKQNIFATRSEIADNALPKYWVDCASMRLLTTKTRAARGGNMGTTGGPCFLDWWGTRAAEDRGGPATGAL